MHAYPVAPPAEVAVNFRRAVITSTALGVAALLALALTGRYAAGVLVCVGLGLGAYNARMVANSVARFAAGDAPYRKRRFMGQVLVRLGAVTAVALLLLVAVHPGGWGVLVGLAVFQLLLLGTAAMPMLREIRRP